MIADTQERIIPVETWFAEPGRMAPEVLVDQVRRSMVDPLVRLVLDAVAGYVMILNEKRQILAANNVLLDALEKEQCNTIIGLRSGEVFNCVHFTEGPDGCGTSPHCRTCGSVLAILASKKKGVPVNDECRLTMFKDGRPQAIDFKVRVTPLVLAENHLTVFVMHDNSSLKRQETLERVFLHDLSNTLSAIEGWSAILHEQSPESAAQNIVALSENLQEEVAFQRILMQAENGALQVAMKTWRVEDILNALHLIFAVHEKTQGKILQIVPAPEKCSDLMTDRHLLLRALVNMVKNALEASNPGDQVTVRFEERQDQVCFVVHNDGKIPDDIQIQIFERSFSTHAESGRGIGTYSMKLFGEGYLGGKVFFESNAEQGTHFTIELPKKMDEDLVKPVVAMPTAVLQPGTSSPGQAPRRVLLVEDEEALMRLGCLFLERVGYLVFCCRSGPEALALVQAEAGKFDLVITDMNMPKMNGLELSRRLLAQCPDLPIVLSSGYLENCDQVVARQIGIRSFLPKPFNLAILNRVLQEVHVA